MKKVIVIPDSFKGTMRSKEVCGTMTRAIQDQKKDIEVISIPVAEGGEGTDVVFPGEGKKVDACSLYVKIK